MSTNTIDPVTGIVIPTPGAEPGPQYAEDISNALETLAHLTHTGAENSDGYQIPTAGLNINDDLSIQSNNLTNIRSTRFVDQVATLNSTGDLNCTYFKDGDFWINNSEGVPVQITSGGLVNATVGSNYPTIDITGNLTINPMDNFIVVAANSISNDILITLPIASDVSAGRFFIIKDVAGTSGTHNISIYPNGSDAIDGYEAVVFKSAFTATMLISDGVANWFNCEFDKKYYENETIRLNSFSKILGDATSEITLGTGHVYGILTADQTVYVGDELHVQGDTSLGRDVSILGDTTIEGISLLRGSRVDITNDLNVGGDVAITGNVSSDISTSRISSFIDGYGVRYNYGADRLINATLQCPGIADPTAWVPGSFGHMYNVTLAGECFFYPNFAQDVKLTQIYVGYLPANTHTAVPTGKPTVSLKYYDWITDTVTTVIATTDPYTASVAIYEAKHEIYLVGFSHTINKTSRQYFITVTAESGTFAQIDAAILYIRVGYTREAEKTITED